MYNPNRPDGPKIAADILNCMSASRRKKLIANIKELYPDVYESIVSRLWDFDDLAELAPQSAQLVVREVSHEDLVVSLKTATEDVRGVLLENMSPRKKQMVEDDLAVLGKVRLSEVDEAQKRILKKVEELRESGRIRTHSKHEVWV